MFKKLLKTELSVEHKHHCVHLRDGLFNCVIKLYDFCTSQPQMEQDSSIGISRFDARKFSISSKQIP